MRWTWIPIAAAALSCTPEPPAEEPPEAVAAAPVSEEDEVDPLARYRWQRRPLLLFAPPDDPRSTLLLERVEATQAEFDDRDMILVEVRGARVSAPGWERNGATAARLRETHGVAASEFAIVLVGLDGGAKARSNDPYTLPDLYARIDRMPMRQAELEARAQRR